MITEYLQSSFKVPSQCHQKSSPILHNAWLKDVINLQLFVEKCQFCNENKQ